MRRIDGARDASPQVVTWGELAVAAGALALSAFVAGEFVRAAIVDIVVLAGWWS